MIVYFESEPDYIRKRLEDIIYSADLVYDRKYRSFQYYYALGCGFDIETSKVELENITISVCYHWQLSIKNFTIGGRSLTSMLDFFTLLDRIAGNKNARLLILDANLNYEFQFCKHYWKKIGISEFFAKDIREPLRMLIGKSLYVAESLGVFGRSLENIADNYCTIKKLKGDLNHNLVRNSKTTIYKKESMYCENDTLILAQLGEYIFKNFFGKKEKFPLTSTARIRNKIKKRAGKKLQCYKNQIKEWMPDEKDYNLLRTYLFKGGICGTNSEFMDIELDDVLMADYTSDYPAKCFHYAFPMGKCRKVDVSIDNIKKALEKNKPFIMKIEFHDLKATTTHSLMSTHKCIDSGDFNSNNITIDNGRIFRAEKATMFLNDIELLSFGFFNVSDRTAYTFDRSKTKILQMWVFDYYATLPDYVLDVIEEEYRKKAKLKEKIEKIKKKEISVSFDEWMNLNIAYQEAKSNVNGIFGMMCTALYTDDLIFDGDEITNKKDEYGNNVYKQYDEAISNLFLYPFWGFWITSYARMVLIDTIIRFPNIIVQYDTDSIYFRNNGSVECIELLKYIEEYNNKIIEINENLFNDGVFRDLGCWDLNKKNYKKFKGLGSKRYMYEDDSGYHITTSGCRSVNVVEYNNKLIDEFSFHIIAENDKLNENQINNILNSRKRMSTIEYQYRVEKPDISLFEYFQDQLEVKKEYANKLCSKYIELDVIAENIPSLKINVTDYQGNICEMEVGSCVVLEPIGFKMGINGDHINLYKAVQSYIENHPNSWLVNDEKLIDEVIEKCAS